MTIPILCEVPRSSGYDPTGEHAQPCNSEASFYCESCGCFYCGTCADETYCDVNGEHVLVAAEVA